MSIPHEGTAAADTPRLRGRQRAGGSGGVLLAGLVAALLALPAPSAAQLQIVAGQGLYEASAYCLGPSAFLSTFRLGYVASGFGLSVTYAREDWPWWEPPPVLLGQAAFRHGDAFQAVAEVYPVRFLAREAGALADRLQPFVGAGLQITGDGEAAPSGGPGDVPIYGVRSAVDPMVTAGLSLVLQPANAPIGLVIQYRFIALFGSDIEFESSTGAIERADGGQTSTWSELSAGVSIPIG